MDGSRRTLVRTGVALGSARRAAPVAVLAVAIAAELVLLVREARHLWFIGDDWDFLITRSLTHNTLDNLFLPHNEHLSAFPIVVFRLFHSLFGYRYLPYALLPMAAHVVVVVGLYFLALRLRARPWTAVLVAIVFLVLAGGVGAENTLWDFQLGFVGSCSFGVLAVLAVLAERTLWRVAGVVALVLSLLCSGVGLVMLAWAAATVLFRRGLLDALRIAVLPAAVYALWYLTYGHDTPANMQSTTPTEGVLAAVHGVATFWSVALTAPGAGPAVLIVLFIATLASRRDLTAFSVSVAGFVALGMFFAMTGLSRGVNGVEATEAPRYVYVGMLLCMPALALAFEIVAQRVEDQGWVGLAVWSTAALATAALGVAQTLSFASERRDLIVGAVKVLRAGLELSDSGEPLLNDAPEGHFYGRLHVPFLRSIEADLPAAPVDRSAMASARLGMQAVISPPSRQLPPFDGVDWLGFPGAPHTQLTGCMTRTSSTPARLRFRSGAQGGQARIRVDANRITAQLKSSDGLSAKYPQLVQRGAFEYAATVQPDASYWLTLPAGKVTVCP